jgi:hypothetical protein
VILIEKHGEEQMRINYEVIIVTIERGIMWSTGEQFFKLPDRNVNTEIILVKSPLEYSCILSGIYGIRSKTKKAKSEALPNPPLVYPDFLVRLAKLVSLLCIQEISSPHLHCKH